MRTKPIAKNAEFRDKAVCKRGSDGTQCEKLCVVSYNEGLLLVCSYSTATDRVRPYSEFDVCVDDLSFDCWAPPTECPRTGEFSTVRKLREL